MSFQDPITVFLWVGEDPDLLEPVEFHSPPMVGDAVLTGRDNNYREYRVTDRKWELSPTSKPRLRVHLKQMA